MEDRWEEDWQGRAERAEVALAEAVRALREIAERPADNVMRTIAREALANTHIPTKGAC